MPNSEVTQPVIIIGAGIAGLQAAFQLEQQSIPYLLIEQSDKVGGRIQTDLLDGYLLDHGFQVLQTSYLGVQRNFYLTALKLRFFESGAHVWIGDQFVPFLNPLKRPFDFIKALKEGVLTISDSIKLARLWLKIQGDIKPIGAAKLDVNQYIQQLNFSKNFYERFIFPFFAGVFLDPNFQQPASLFDFYLKQFLEGQAALPENGIKALAEQLLHRLNPDSVLLNTLIVKIDTNEVQLASGKKITFSNLKLACDAKGAAQLLGVELDADSFNACTTYYFSADEFPNDAPLIHLLPKNSGAILHFSCLSNIQASYAPKGKKLISVTSLSHGISSQEIAKELELYTGQLKGLKFLKSYFIPHALPRVGQFESLKKAAADRNITLLGDYAGFPSLQSAFQ
ncbi:FAD-dependent oxidoreductase [Aquirufa sp. ROCK-SH2]